MSSQSTTIAAPIVPLPLVVARLYSVYVKGEYMDFLLNDDHQKSGLVLLITSQMAPVLHILGLEAPSLNMPSRDLVDSVNDLNTLVSDFHRNAPNYSFGDFSLDYCTTDTLLAILEISKRCADVGSLRGGATGAKVFGNLSVRQIAVTCGELNIGEKDRFIDIGCGYGQLMCTVAALTQAEMSTGIEYQKHIYDADELFKICKVRSVKEKQLEVVKKNTDWKTKSTVLYLITINRKVLEKENEPVEKMEYEEAASGNVQNNTVPMDVVYRGNEKKKDDCGRKSTRIARRPFSVKYKTQKVQKSKRIPPQKPIKLRKPACETMVPCQNECCITKMKFSKKAGRYQFVLHAFIHSENQFDTFWDCNIASITDSNISSCSKPIFHAIAAVSAYFSLRCWYPQNWISIHNYLIVCADGTAAGKNYEKVYDTPTWTPPGSTVTHGPTAVHQMPQATATQGLAGTAQVFQGMHRTAPARH
ncbi:hypothetical protein L3Y34_011465 [Caenorhabditis briggsae]|uniref:Histone-lysine N-methyltransferase, H3 lysine-79 specific n=1 Tax=Caenorhabditis briggsae TaxID=6238 RepID=A0AAE9CTZ9_CAEBR|nr:hypothetical protein L3Y34_011465 [Caenorhabditis briggsae]